MIFVPQGANGLNASLVFTYYLQILNWFHDVESRFNFEMGAAAACKPKFACQGATKRCLPRVTKTSGHDICEAVKVNGRRDCRNDFFACCVNVRGAVVRWRKKKGTFLPPGGAF